jgi:D-alanine-D-alanine ligase
VYQLGIGDDVDILRVSLAETRPHIVFNQLVHFHGTAAYDQHVVSYLELLRQPYTGCNPRGLTLARDKALTKKILKYHGIRVPGFEVYPFGGRLFEPSGLEYPLLVKSLDEEASLGITQESVVHTKEKLLQRVQFMHETYRVDVVVEEYIAGRELYVGVLGNDRLTSYPVWELPFTHLPEGAPHIATERLKFDLAFQKRNKIRTGRAEGLSKAEERRIAKSCREVYQLLGLSGYARIDLRYSPEGKVYFLEANPNPDIKRGEDFAESAHSVGVTYPALLERIMSLALGYAKRWR